MNPNFVVHVGFSKTGTTTQQKHLFSKHSQIRYLGKPHEQSMQDFLVEMIRQETTLYDPAPFREYIQTRIKNQDLQGKQVLLLSDEMILSRWKSIDKGIVAERVKEIFSPCRIMFTIRNQMEILKSAYLASDRLLQNVPKPYWGLSVNFNNWLEHSYQSYQAMDRNYISHADYFKTIAKYIQLFGRENVGVFVLEEFIHHQESYIDKLAQFLKIDAAEARQLVADKHEHKEISQYILNFERLQTKLFPYSRFRGFSFLLRQYFKLSKALHTKEKSAQVTIPEHWKKQLSEIFAPGNRQLAEQFNLPLEKYGYPL